MNMANAKRFSQPAFFVFSALLFVISTAVTIVWCTSMSMTEMSMPGGWKMSMAWMKMPGQTWAVAAISFLAMWIAMMVAMMLPSFVPMLRRYRLNIDTTNQRRIGWLTALVTVGYFFIWTLFGLIAFPLGVALAMIETQQPEIAKAVPIVVGVVVLIAGLFQFTSWKMRHLSCYLNAHGNDTLNANAGSAWRHGLRLGFHCVYCCANLMAILLVIGVMDLRAMAVVAVAITIERLLPDGGRVAQITGAGIVATGLYMIVRAILV